MKICGNFEVKNIEIEFFFSGKNYRNAGRLSANFEKTQ